ncbi:MAG: hypothetical protein ACKVZ0_05670 [Gemmatimonadales bacterium]
MHTWLAAFGLHSGVPEEVRIQYDLARNLYLYSWHVYGFLSVAQFQSVATIELALRHRMKEHPRQRAPTFKPLIMEALAEGLLTPESLTSQVPQMQGAIGWVVDASPSAAPERVDATIELLTLLRNDVAHGNRLLLPDAFMVLRIAKSVIGDLYPSQERESDA